MSQTKARKSTNGENSVKSGRTSSEKDSEGFELTMVPVQRESAQLVKLKPTDSSEAGNESDTSDSNELVAQVAIEKRQRRKTIVNSFRLAELIPTSNTPFSSYRKKSIALTAHTVVDSKANYHFIEGITKSEDGDHYRAIACFNKAICLKPELIRYYIARGESLLQICDFQSAILNYKKACILDPENNEYYSRLAFIYFFQGQCLYDEKLYAQALESFSRAAEMKPEIIGYHTRSVACLSALQRHGECLALVNKRLEEESSNPDIYIMRARLHELFRNSTLCYYDVKDALALSPDNAEAKSLMSALQKRAYASKLQAEQLYLVGKIKEALTKISIAIETNPSVPEYHVFRGALHRKNSDFNAAIDDFLLAMDKTDHDETHTTYKDAQRQLLLSYNDFSVECFGKGYFDEAIVLLNKAIKGEKCEKGLYINRGDCFFRANELHFALADYQQALEMDPTSLSIRSRLSIVYNEFGILEYYDRHYLECIDYLTTAISYNPRIGAYYLSRARARYMIEDSDGAREDVLKCLYLNPDSKDVVSIFSRLFPGRTIADVTKGHLGVVAARAVEAHIRDTYGPPMPTVTSSVKESQFSGKGVLPPIRDSFFPEIRVCMEEQDFHINIIKSKQKATKVVKKAFKARQNLSIKGPRVEVPAIQAPADVKTFKWETSVAERAFPSATSRETQRKALNYLA